jgi:anti-sigma-K factor RskA
MTREEHDEVRDLIAPYVLGAVSADETARIRSHLLACEECLFEADRYSMVSSSLVLAVAPSPLPKGFADRVVERATTSEPPSGAEPPLGSAVRRRRWPGHALAYAALLGIVAVLAGGLVADRRDDAMQQRAVQAVLHGQGMALRGPGGAVGRMVPTANGGLFVASGLDPAPEGHTHQLWFIEGSEPVSAGTFETSRGLAVVTIDRSLEGVDAVAVTIEPEGGSRKPTTKPIIASA